MIADAIRSVVPGALHVSVDIITCRFTDPKLGNHYIYMMPRQGQAAILAYDKGEDIDPFKLILSGGQVIPFGHKTLKGKRDPMRVARGNKAATTWPKSIVADKGGYQPAIADGNVPRQLAISPQAQYEEVRTMEVETYPPAMMATLAA